MVVLPAEFYALAVPVNAAIATPTVATTSAVLFIASLPVARSPGIARADPGLVPCSVRLLSPCAFCQQVVVVTVLCDLRLEEHSFIYASWFFLVQLNSGTVLGDHRSDRLWTCGQDPPIGCGQPPSNARVCPDLPDPDMLSEKFRSGACQRACGGWVRNSGAA